MPRENRTNGMIERHRLRADYNVRPGQAAKRDDDAQPGASSSSNLFVQRHLTERLDVPRRCRNRRILYFCGAFCVTEGRSRGRGSRNRTNNKCLQFVDGEEMLINSGHPVSFKAAEDNRSPRPVGSRTDKGLRGSVLERRCPLPLFSAFQSTQSFPKTKLRPIPD